MPALVGLPDDRFHARLGRAGLAPDHLGLLPLLGPGQTLRLEQHAARTGLLGRHHALRIQLDPFALGLDRGLPLQELLLAS